MAASTPEPPDSAAESAAESATELATELAGAPASEPTEDSGPAADEAVPDDARRKFREALERKRARHADQHGDEIKGGSKVRDTRGPAARRRTFRRKSG